MKKFIVLILSLIISIPFFTFSPSAATYTLSDPLYWNTAFDDAYSLYFPYNVESDSFLPSYSGQIGKYFAYYDKSWTDFWASSNLTPFWTLGSLVNFSTNYEVISKRNTGTENVLVSCFRGDVSNAFLIPGFRFSGVYLPQDGQYLKINFSLSVQQYSPLPDPEFLNYQNLFFLIPHSMQNRVISPGVVPPTTVIRSRNSDINLTSYDVYFDLNNLAFDQYGDDYIQEPFDLVIRIPFYFPDNQYYDTQVMMASDVSFPTSYEILSVGGYNQEIEAVENAVIKGFDDLDSILTDQTEQDVIFTDSFDSTLDDLKDTVSDYKEQDDILNNVDSSIVLPPLNDVDKSDTMESLDLPSFSNLTLLWNDLITEMLVLVISLGISGAILYGKKA